MQTTKIKYVKGTKRFDYEWLAQQVDQVITDAWGEWGIEYIKNHVLTSDYIYFALCDGDVVGISSARKFKYGGDWLYYFEFVAIRKRFQGQGISEVLNVKIVTQIFVDRFIRLKTSFAMLTISPNPRILGSVLRSAEYVYPNLTEEKAPTSVWKKITFLVEALGDPYNSISRTGSVIQGFYDDCPELIYQPEAVPRDKEETINNFAWKMLKYKEKMGREFVIYAEYNLHAVWRQLIRKRG